MESNDTKTLTHTLRKARELLAGLGECPWEGVNANVKRAIISIEQALYDIGEEEPREG